MADRTDTEPISLCVVIPNFNYACFIGDAIESVLRSTRPADEIMVIDDGSTDDSAEVVVAFDEVELVRRSNSGQSDAVFHGAHRSRSDVVVLLDSDDTMSADRLEWVAAAFDDPEVVMAWHPLRIDDGSGGDRGICPETRLPSGHLAERLGAGTVTTFALSSGLSIRRSAFEQLGPIPVEFRNAADSLLVRSVPFLGAVAATDRALGTYRVHDASESRRGVGRSSDSMVRLLDRRLALAEDERRLVVQRANEHRVQVDERALGQMDGMYVDLALGRARLSAPSRRAAWNDAAAVDARFSTRPTVVSRILYTLSPKWMARALLEIKLGSTSASPARRVAAALYWRLTTSDLRPARRRRSATAAESGEDAGSH
ncbi:glycosyltransferase family 2 protein [Ilumatobacter sp.]|uniref:glycosyltransferase family 2 protein n=1 Tax=Ilumatobacter sp. TaxID=1967498 RepID=UPI003B529C9A